MFYFLTYLMNLMSSTLFMMMKHPLSMGLTLFIQTILICLMTGIFSKTFWFSYILFLIFLGGMLVLFIYVISLASNEIFFFSMKMLFMMSILFIFMMLFYMFFFNNFFFSLNLSNMEMESLMNQKSFIKENKLYLEKLYNFPSNLITIMMMIYLFLTLIAIVKITSMCSGPLRQKFNKSIFKSNFKN